MPSPWLWQCHHATQIVTGPEVVKSAAMPCEDMAMAKMPCCHFAVMEAKRPAPTHQAITAPGCHPKFTQLAALPAAQLNPDPFRHHLAAAIPFYALNTSPVLLLLPTTPELCRPPPFLELPASLRLHTLTPRAPPIA